MKLSRQKREELSSATITHSLVLVFLCSGLFALTAYASNPSWWSSPGTGTQGAVVAEQVVTNDGVVSTNYITNNYAVVVQGQLKQFTARAVDELNSNLTGGAGTNLNNLVHGWAQDYATNGYNASNIEPSDYTAMTAGQLKYVGNKVWTQLVARGYTNALPAWLDTNSTDIQLANLGQLKQVFNFDLSTMVPATITSLTASDSNPGEIDLSWTLPTVNDGTSIIIQQSTDGGTTWTTVATLTDPDLTSYAVTGLSGGSSYTFQVALQNNAGTSTYTSSGTALSPVPAAPASPTALTGSFDASGNMNLTWTASTGATSYLVERETLSTGTWSSLGTPTGATYQDTGYGAGGYHYRVSAINLIGTSAPSTEFPRSRYAVIDLGQNNVPASLNNHGDVVGNNTNSNQPFLWHQGMTTNLATASNFSFQATYIIYDGGPNEDEAPEIFPTYQQAFTPSSTLVADINDSGVIVGSQTQDVSYENDPALEANEEEFAAQLEAGIFGGDPIVAAGTADYTFPISWASGSAAPVIFASVQADFSGTNGYASTLFDDFNYSEPANQISNINSVLGFPLLGGELWSSPSAQPVGTWVGIPLLNGINANIESMNRNGDLVVDWPDPGYRNLQGLLKQGGNTPVPLSGSPYSGHLVWPVVAFTDTAPYIYVYGDSAQGQIYDSGTGQTFVIGYAPFSISTPTDPTKVQAIGQASFNYPLLWEKTGPLVNSQPTWNTNALNFNDLLAPQSGFQMQSVAKINNGGAIVGTATYSGTNTAIAAGSHGVLLLPLSFVRETPVGSGTFTPIKDNGLDDQAKLPIYSSDTGSHIVETDTGGYTMGAVLSTDLTGTSTASINVTYAISGGGSYTGTLTETAAGSGIFHDSGGTNILTLTPTTQTTSSTASSILSATITIPSLSISSQPVTLVWMNPLTFQATSMEVGVALSGTLSTTAVNSITAAFYNHLTEIDATTLTETGVNTRIFKDSAGDITLTMSGFTGGTSMNVSVNATGATPSSFGATLTETSGTSLQYANYTRSFGTESNQTPATDGQAVFYVQFPGTTATSITLVSGGNSVTATASPVSGQPGLLRTGKLVLLEPSDTFSASGYTTLQVSYPSGGANPSIQLQMYGQTIVDPGAAPHALVGSCISPYWVVNQGDAVDHIETDLTQNLGWAVVKQPLFTTAMLNDAVNKCSLFYLLTEGVTSTGQLTDSFQGFETINTVGILWNTFDKNYPANIPQVPSTKHYALVFINGCKAGDNDALPGDLPAAIPDFISKFNTKAYVGWNQIVLPSDAAKGANLFFDNLSKSKTVDEAIAATNDAFHAGGVNPQLAQLASGGGTQVIDLTGSK